MPDGLVPVTSAAAPRYRYYTVNIVTNTVIGEIPFEDVSFTRSIKTAGAFEGKITISEQTNNLDLYNSTMPGKTAIYVVRDDQAVWGGIIWGRTYDLQGRSLAVSGSEFTSYFGRRLIWKSYSNSFTAQLVKRTKDGYTLVTLQNNTLREALDVTDAEGNPTYVNVRFVDSKIRKYSGFYKVVGKASDPAAPANPGQTAFYVDIPNLPHLATGIYDGVGVTLKSDTYAYLRDILEATLSDFISVQFPNEIITPGVKVPYRIATKQLSIANSAYGTATLTTSDVHDLTVGQRVEVVNVDAMLDGQHIITEIPNKFSFKYILNNPISRSDYVSPIYLDSSLSSATNVTNIIDKVKYREVIQFLPQYVRRLSRSLGIVTVTFNSVHNFKKGNKVILDFESSKATQFKIKVTTKDAKTSKTTTKIETVNTFDYDKYNNTVTVLSATPTTITYEDPNPDYASSGYNRTANTVNIGKNSVKLATELPLLRIYPDDSSGYNIGDDVRVDGVDDAGWGYPIYDGYHKVYDIDPGTALTISKYAVVSEYATEDEDDTSYLSSVVYLYTALDPSYEAGDWITTTGFTSGAVKLNGRYQVLSESYYDASQSLYVIKFAKNHAAISLTTVSGATVIKTGGSWLVYEPATSETRFSLKSEPDSATAISGLGYKPAKGKTKNKVTVVTKTRHGLATGDTVDILYTLSGKDDKTQKIYGGRVTVTSVGDVDEFSYTLIKDKHAEAAPKDAISGVLAKKGTVVRIKHSVLNPPHVQVPVEGLRSESLQNGGSLVTIYSPDHDLSVNDYVSVSIDDKTYSSYSTTQKPVKIKQAAENYFSYESGAPTIAGDSATVTAIKYLESGKKIRFQVNNFGTFSAVSTTASSITFSPSTGHVTFTTPSPHGLVVGRKVKISGFPDPTTQSVAGTTVSRTIDTGSVIRYNSSKKTVFIKFTAAHGLSPLEDVDTATLTIAGATDWVEPPDTSDWRGTSLAWLNATHAITDIPDKFSVGIKYLGGGSSNWTVLGSGLGTPSTVNIATQTKPAMFVPAADYSKFNFTADVVQVPSNTKIVFNYPDSADDNFTGTVTMASLGITVSVVADAQKGSGAEQLEANDFVKLSGLGDNGTNLYSKLNRDGYKVVLVETATGSSKYITILNPLKSGGKAVAYQNRTFTGTPIMTRGYDVGGNVIVSNAQGYAGVDRNAYSIERVRMGAVVSTTGTIGTVTTSGSNYIATITGMSSTTGLTVGEVVLATAGTGNVGSGTMVVSTINSSTSISVRSTATFTAGTITNLRGMAATVTLTGVHDLLAGEYVNVRVFNDDFDSFSQNNRDVTLLETTSNTLKYNVRKATNIEYISFAAGKATVYFDGGANGSHGYSIGDTVTIAGILSPYTGFNAVGVAVIATGPTSITYASAASTSKLTKTVVTAGTVSRTAAVAIDSSVGGVVNKVPTITKIPVVFARTYGEFPGNANIGGLTLSTQEYSNQNMENSPLYGSKLQSLSEVLEAYSNTKSGFDYRVDVALDYDTNGNKVFTRTFVLKPIFPKSLTDYLATLPDGKLARGQVATPNAFGADKVIFEYPGNVSNVSLAEKAENAATRVFVSGNSSGAGAGAEAPYSAAAATDLLADSWPLLDKKESVKWPSATSSEETTGTSNTDEWGNHDDETDYHISARRFLSEFRPPAGDFIIDVNGSLTPVIGSYDPGDWCSIIINDNFVKTRLNSVLEPRKDVIVRKIDAIKVAVPNNPAFPEKISLTLVTDWEVDAVGK